jgi:hypothetical protein
VRGESEQEADVTEVLILNEFFIYTSPLTSFYPIVRYYFRSFPSPAPTRYASPFSSSCHLHYFPIFSLSVPSLPYFMVQTVAEMNMGLRM